MRVLDGKGVAMTPIIDKRVTAEIEGDFVVFLIGMRINRLWKASKWLPVFLAMPKMARELEQNPASGFLGAKLWNARFRARLSRRGARSARSTCLL
jgi:hypothetical protein